MTIRMNPAQAGRSGTRRAGLVGLVLFVAVATALVAVGPSHRTAQAAAAITGLHVQGNQILNSGNQPVRLLGVDRSGTEYACIQGWGIFDGPSDATSVQAIASWHVNAVRVPLNEDCWLNINMGTSTYGGSTYQQAVVNYVNLLNSYGIAAILDLHWNAPGTTQATGQQPMPDEDHAPAFWQSVATTFLGNSSVIFDVYNEPYPDSNQDTTAGWQCWRDGGTCPGVSFQAAGMQQLVTTIRNTGSTNIIMLGGLEYSNALSQWLTYKPSDPQNNLAASWHSYNFNVCNTQSCWDGTVAPVAQQVPLIAGEIGENDCAHGYIDPLMIWMDNHNASYLGWTWDTWNCSSGPALISDYSGTPTGFGVGLQQHLAALASASPTPTATPGPPTSTPTKTPTPTTIPTATPTPTSTPASPNFSLNASPTTQSVPSGGGTRTYTISITPSNGFAGQVTLSATGQPSSSTVGFSPNPATSGSTLTIKTVSGTARGTYTITVHGASGSLSHTTSVTLTVTRH